MTETVKGWERRTLGDVITVKHGFAFRGEFFADAGPYVVLTPGNFHEEGGFKPKSGKEKYYTAEPPTEFLLAEGDLIVAMTEQAEGLLGSSALVPVSDFYLHNQRIGLVIVNAPEVIDKRFLYYAFNTRSVRAQLQATATGSKVRHTAPSRIEAVDLLLPPLRAQQRIGAVLGAYDELIENNSQRIRAVEKMAQTVFREWFVEFRYPGHADEQLVDSDLGPIPEMWRAGTLGSFVQMHRRNVDPTKLVSEIFAHFSIPSFDSTRLPAIENGASIKSLKYQLPGPCVLYSKLNPRIPRVWLATPDPRYRSIASTEFVVLTPMAGWSLSMIFSLCSSAEFADQVTGMAGGTSTSHQRAKPQELLAMRVIDPPSELVALFDGTVGPMLDLAQQLRTTSENLRTTRDLLLPRLISGEIDVSPLGVDVGDETA